MSDRLPLVEIFQTIEGEGTKAGYPTTFVRLYNCNLRCSWCDTKYSYAPHPPRFFAIIDEIVNQVNEFGHAHLCLTGGEPLMHGEKLIKLIHALSHLDFIEDIHIETNGAIDLAPFEELRQYDFMVKEKVRFIMDYKLPSSDEMSSMIHSNFTLLDDCDEIKFVVATEEDYEVFKDVLIQYVQKGTVLLSPAWGQMPPSALIERILKDRLTHVKINMQLHKVIWGPEAEGV